MDTSALTKLLVAEPETPELREWLTAQSGQGEYAATSALGRVELMRVVARYGEPGRFEHAHYLLDGLDLFHRKALADRVVFGRLLSELLVPREQEAMLLVNAPLWRA